MILGWRESVSDGCWANSEDPIEAYESIIPIWAKSYPNQTGLGNPVASQPDRPGISVLQVVANALTRDGMRLRRGNS